jgi:hypothetical protein
MITALARLEIRQLPVAELKEAPYNPRVVLPPSSAQYRRLRNSLLHFGLVEPLIWNETTGYVVGGHLRLRILRELGVTEVPVSVVRLPPRQEMALNVILNNEEAQGRFDHRRLLGVLQELAQTSELELSGFDAESLRELEWELQPLEELSTEETASSVAQVHLEVPLQRWAAVEPDVDALVRRHDLRCHLRLPTKTVTATTSPAPQKSDVSAPESRDHKTRRKRPKNPDRKEIRKHDDS